MKNYRKELYPGEDRDEVVGTLLVYGVRLLIGLVLLALILTLRCSACGRGYSDRQAAADHDFLCYGRMVPAGGGR